jgi:hypothetical protein
MTFLFKEINTENSARFQNIHFPKISQKENPSLYFYEHKKN